jgi:hypothetical protein
MRRIATEATEEVIRAHPPVLLYVGWHNCSWFCILQKDNFYTAFYNAYSRAQHVLYISSHCNVQKCVHRSSCEHQGSGHYRESPKMHTMRIYNLENVLGMTNGRIWYITLLSSPVKHEDILNAILFASMLYIEVNTLHHSCTNLVCCSFILVVRYVGTIRVS